MNARVVTLTTSWAWEARRFGEYPAAMPRSCSVCTHPQRNEIERTLLTTQPVMRIAANFGVAESSLRRHRDRHLTRRLALARDGTEQIDADRLMEWVTALQGKTLLLLTKAEADQDWLNARGLIGEARKNIELLGRLCGALDGTRVTVDARQQSLTVLASLSEDELRALARQALASEQPAFPRELEPA